MANKDIQLLLQKCLEGYNAGLTPEECLSPYAHARSELEPLFRQALALRIAYASSPRPEFRYEARERLLFAAGRDVGRALAAEPDPDFVHDTRQRLLNTAGAGAQEALRDVPPPRLPFWINARRHLLETASSTPPRPAPVVAAARMRTVLSAAVVVLAVAVAGASFFAQGSPESGPPQTAVAADLQYLREQVGTAEQLTASGQAVSSSVLDELATVTGRLAEQYAVSGNETELKETLPDLIERQQNLAALLPPGNTLGETLATAQELLAGDSTSVVDDPDEPVATPDTTAVTSPTPETSPEPDLTATPEIEIPTVTAVQPTDLQEGQVVLQFDPDVTELDLRWWRVTTADVTFVIPEAWTVTNIEVDDNGLAVLSTGILLIETDVGNASLAVWGSTGEVTLINAEGQTLRSEGPDGIDIDPVELATLMNDDIGWLALYNMLDSIEVAR